MSYGLLRRWSRAARSSIIERAPGPARRTFALGDLERGWVVRDSEGRRIGTIVGWAGGGSVIVVSRGLFSVLRVPQSAIGEVHEGVVRLNVPAAWLEAHEKPPARS